MPARSEEPMVELMFVRCPVTVLPEVLRHIQTTRSGIVASGQMPEPNGTRSEQTQDSHVDSIPTQYRLWWQGLQDQAKLLVKVIAQHAPAYNWDELRDETGMSGREVSGHLSSGGHQLRRVRAIGYDLPEVIQRDWNGRRYLIDPEVAGYILRLAQEDQED